MHSFRARSAVIAHSGATDPSINLKAQIVSADPTMLMVRGAENFQSLPAAAGTHLGGVHFWVDGAESGRAMVAITLAANDAAIVTSVRVNKNGNNSQLAQRLTVPCLELMQTIDRIIERD
jgi:hypothetical protein